MQLWKKFGIAFITIIIVLSLAVGMASYTMSQTLIISNKKDDMANSLNLIDINITEQISTLNRMADSVSEDLRLDSSFMAGDDKLQETDVDTAWLGDICKIYKSISNIYILNDDRDIIYKYDTTEVSLDIDEIESLLQESEQDSNRKLWSELYDHTVSGQSANTSIMLIKGIVDPHSAAHMGTLIIEFDPDSLANLLINNISTFKHQYTFILDSDDTIISANNSVKLDYIDEVSKLYTGINSQFQFSWDGADYYACGQYNGITGWRLFSIIAIDDIFPQLTLLKWNITMIVIIFVIVSFIASIAMAWSLTKPMNELSYAMKKLETGDFDVHITSSRNDEIGSLIKSYNYMVSEIKRLIDEVYEKKVAQRNSELKALQSQINPHFLYNTLDAINWMLIARGEDDISDIIISLGSLMKYSIAGDIKLVKLIDEVDYIKNYLMIQKYRMEDKLNYDIEISPEFMEYMVPKLLLKPIVENAITHGIEPRSIAGHIGIAASSEGDELVITITDDGVGIEAEDIDKIYAGEGGIGLINVHKRIKLYFGDSFGIQIHSQKGCGTVVAMHLPAKTSGGSHENSSS